MCQPLLRASSCGLIQILGSTIACFSVALPEITTVADCFNALQYGYQIWGVHGPGTGIGDEAQHCTTCMMTTSEMLSEHVNVICCYCYQQSQHSYACINVWPGAGD